MNGDGEVRQTRSRTRMDVRGYLLAEAERMIRANGFEAFTLGRLSDRIGMRISSIQAHFRTREELSSAVVDAHLSKLTAALDAIERRCIPATAKLSAYSRIFRDLADRQMPIHNALEHENRARADLSQHAKQISSQSNLRGWNGRSTRGKLLTISTGISILNKRRSAYSAPSEKQAWAPDASTIRTWSGRFFRASGGLPKAKEPPSLNSSANRTRDYSTVLP